MSASDDYADSVCRAAAAHVCLAVGASRTYPSVLDTLSDVTKQYVTTIGLHARNVAETGARTDVSVVDVLAAMKQMGAGGCHWADLNEFAFNDVGRLEHHPRPPHDGRFDLDPAGPAHPPRLRHPRLHAHRAGHARV